MGLMYGVEIIKKKGSTDADKLKAAFVFEAMRDQGRRSHDFWKSRANVLLGVIMGLGGLYKNVLRVMPPMAVTNEVSSVYNGVSSRRLSRS